MNLKNIQSETARANSCRGRAFTLVELLLVLTILAILASIVLPRLTGRPTDAKITATKVQIANIGMAISMFEMDNGSFPKNAQGLQALVARPTDAQNTWKGPYLQVNKVPLDPWNKAYVYENPGKHNPAGFDLYSNGKDGLGGTNVIGNWIPD
jgi:general secretion pathway protein G